jgi:sugar phosphate isomerase/epimerase
LLSLTWDIGHTNILKGTNKKEEEDFFIRFLDRIKNCHIHDNNGEWDEHNIIGKGNIDFKKYFSILNNTNSYFILEVRPKERAIKSYKRLKFLLSS